jgi:hypothetical protein
MPDEVNLCAGNIEFTQAIALGVEFLHSILAEEGEAGARRFRQGLGGMHFGNAHQPHFFTGTTSAPAGCGNACFHAAQLVRE